MTVKSCLTLCGPIACSTVEKAMAPHSSTCAWQIQWMEEPGGLQSMGSRVRQDWATSLSLFTSMHWRRKWQPTPVFLSGESQGRVARWAAVYGVTQSRTRLKLLSSSSRYLIILFSPVYSKKLSYFHISIVAFPFCFITINSSGFLSLIWGLNR